VCKTEILKLKVINIKTVKKTYAETDFECIKT